MYAPCFIRTLKGFGPLSFYTGMGRTMREAFGSDRGVFSVESELTPQKTTQNQPIKQAKPPKNRGPSHKSPMTDQKDFGGTKTCYHNLRKFELKSLSWAQPHQLHSERYL